MEDIIEKLAEQVESFDFIPTEPQRIAKAKLMGILADHPMMDLNALSINEIAEMVKDRRIKSWVKLDGFEDWLKNKFEFKQKVEALTELALDSVRRILTSTNPKMASAQISAFKALLEVGNKMPSKQATIKFQDDRINDMDPIQLDEFMKKAGYIKAPAPQLLEGLSNEPTPREVEIIDTNHPV